MMNGLSKIKVYSEGRQCWNALFFVQIDENASLCIEDSVSHFQFLFWNWSYTDPGNLKLRTCLGSD